METVGCILVVTALVMFGNLAHHDWADTRRLVLAFVFLGIGGVLCILDYLLERRNPE